MPNSFYNTTSFPATGSAATSASMRAELARIAAGFDKLPALASNANKIVVVNLGATGLDVLAAPAGDLVGTSSTQTLTGKSISMASNTLTGTLAQFNTALTDADFATLAGVETLTNKTISGGAINGTPIGAGAASTGAFSSISVSGAASIGGNTTLSGGTANGVAYLNGSKVLTTGSALTFDGTNLTLAGYGRSTGTGWQVANNGIVSTYGANATGTLISNDGNAPIQFQISGGEQMRLTSTGLGIGTSSPTVKLDVNGAIATSESGASSILFRTSGTTNYSWANQYPSAGNLSLYDHGAGATVLTVNAGNLGIGTSSPSTKLDVVGAISATVVAGAAAVRSIASSGGDVIELIPQGAGGGGIMQSTNNAGSAYSPLFVRGTTVTIGAGAGGTTVGAFSSTGLAVTGALSATGNVAAGYGGDGALSSLRSDNTSSIASVLNIARGNASGTGFNISTTGDGANGVTSFLIRKDGTTWANLTDGNLGLGATPSAWASGAKAIELFDNQGSLSSFTGPYGQITLSSNAYGTGNADIGFTTWRYARGAVGDLGAAGQYRITGANHTWFTAPSGTAGNAITFTQAMTLDASGNLLVGTTNAVLVSGYSSRINLVYPGGSSQYGFALRPDADNTTAITFCKADGTAIVGSITQTASATAYNTSSDYRLKNITGPITTSGAYIDSLNPVEGTWKADGSTFVGLIAHEVQEASRTNVAIGEKDGEQMQGMDYSSAEIIANLIAEVQSLRKRLAAAGI